MLWWRKTRRRNQWRPKRYLQSASNNSRIWWRSVVLTRSRSSWRNKSRFWWWPIFIRSRHPRASHYVEGLKVIDCRSAQKVSLLAVIESYYFVAPFLCSEIPAMHLWVTQQDRLQTRRNHLCPK
jgi:hypothetical protein